jgi:hypothetical protein
MKTEEAVYRAARLAYIPPELREGRIEIQWARAGTVPCLLSASDIQGLFSHAHALYRWGKYCRRDGDGGPRPGVGLTSTDIANTASFSEMKERLQGISARPSSRVSSMKVLD